MQINMDITGFTAAILPIALSPGASFTMAMSNAARSGLRGVAPVIAGTATGIYIHATLAGLGVSNLLARSSAAMWALKIGGTIYLMWLGLRMIGEGLSGVTRVEVTSLDSVKMTSAITANLLNVKPLLLYLTVVPLFAGANLSSYFLAASIHVSIMALLLTLCGAAFATAAKAAGSSDVMAAFNIIAGIFLLTLAAKAAW
ncbi:LysE family translocator [Methylocystis sp. JR02]|uniref:LysE family translocator n=1 Tax=Methylocystis sp. JR02 TaxID=3046284 RepID=UPI0024BB7611|nr:LysE family translocator [Methylocystis sp. JR02]MDJ0448542.1 LysE family translocator [Methylocystis sp. JR02]